MGRGVRERSNQGIREKPIHKVLNQSRLVQLRKDVNMDTVIITAVITAIVVFMPTSWFYERELEAISARIPTGPPPEQPTPGIPDEYLRPLMYAGLFEGDAHLGIRMPWTPEGDQA
jgi:hypothetical protein